jgi:methyl-accepting chemotaxis protein
MTKIFITRFKLYAATFRLISALPPASLLVRKCAAPIHCLSIFIICGALLTRLITGPIVDAVHVAETIAKGDLTQTINPTGNDEAIPRRQRIP